MKNSQAVQNSAPHRTKIFFSSFTNKPVPTINPSPSCGWRFERFWRRASLTSNECERRFSMFTRIVECRVKPDKRDEFNNKLRNDVLPILQKQPGFVDLIGLTSESDAERVISVSFWKSKEDAERYHREQYNRIVDTLKPTLRKDPTVETFNVETSTTHRIAAGKAA
jgi:heme-degrading monooxygenase HmoA